MTSQSALPASKPHPLLARSYWARTLAYAFGSLLVLTAMPDAGPVAKGAVLGIGLAYPTLYYHAAMRTQNTRFWGIVGYRIDALLWSAAIIAAGYSMAILLTTIAFALVSQVLMLGVRLSLPSLLIMLVVVFTGQFFVEVDLDRGQSLFQVLYAYAIGVGFFLYLAVLVNQATRRFVDARHQIEQRNHEFEEQAAELAALGELAKLVNSTLDIDQVLETIRERLNRVFNFNQMAILFLDEEREVLRLDRMVGDVPEALLERLEGLDIPMAETHSVFTRTVRENTPHYLPDVSKDIGAAEGVSAVVYSLVPAKSLLTFPLGRGDEAVGVLVFSDTREPFHLDEKDIRSIERYVTHIVSALRNANDFRAIEEARAAADAANIAKSQFLANMSHELRTPMNAVIGYTEMLEEEAEDQGLDDFLPDLKKIRTAGNHLLRLINDVLDLSKIEAEKVDLDAEETDFDELLEEIESTIQPLIDKNSNDLWVRKEGELGKAYVDKTKLRQVVLNLLSNAAKFTRAGRVSLTATREPNGETDTLTIAVGDTGIGMTEAQLEHVFEPFAQADASTTREYGGTGLGLSISRKFIEMMGGTLTAHSRQGHGSTFTLVIPVEAQDKTKNLATRVRAAALEPGDLDCDVLVIDDDESIRELMERVLGREGLRVRCAASGAEGLELAKAFRPKVITLDVLMPGRDGWSVLSQLKGDPELAKIPVVMQTIVDETRKGLSLGAAEYLTKPIDRGQLLDTIRRLHVTGKRRALVVEDDRDIRNLVAGWLESDGWDVRTAVNGREGLTVYDATPPSLVILDLMMPEVDGFDFLDGIRERDDAMHASVVVVTAKDLTPEDLERLDGGIERIIQKRGRDAEEIVAEIGRHLGRETRHESEAR